MAQTCGPTTNGPRFKHRLHTGRVSTAWTSATGSAGAQTVTLCTSCGHLGRARSRVLVRYGVFHGGANKITMTPRHCTVTRQPRDRLSGSQTTASPIDTAVRISLDVSFPASSRRDFCKNLAISDQCTQAIAATPGGPCINCGNLQPLFWMREAAVLLQQT